MAFYTGVANDLGAILVALRDALSENGWSQSGDVFSRGGCHVELCLADVGSFTSIQNVLRCVAGNGVSGSVLQDRAPAGHAIGTTVADTSYGIAWPAEYFIHVHQSPDEVFLLVNYDVDCWQWIAFGKSGTASLPGTGNWAGGSFGVPSEGRYTYSHVRWPFVAITAAAGGGGNQDAPSTALFWNTDGSVNPISPKNATSTLHHGLGGTTWSMVTPAMRTAAPAIARSPSAWNQEAILIPIQPIFVLPESKVAIVGELKHARYLRIDNYNPGELITLGADRWRVYPWYRKNSSVRNGGIDIDHTGTFGWAIRYDGE